MNHKKTILWDWNGTLLNDVNICIDAINILLRDRKKPVLDEEVYREIFTFPVRDYYVKAGFDFNVEPFEKPALQFIENYEEMIRDTDLFEDVIPALEAFRDLGYRQMILSAMHQDLLNDMVEKRGIAHFFEHISGIDDHYAAGKVEYGRRLLKKIESTAGEIILIGDTMHDHEVGTALGIETVLVSRGHQSERRLRACNCKIAANMSELRELISK